MSNCFYVKQWTLKTFIIYLLLNNKFPMISTHFRCRGGLYPRSSIERFPVPDDKVSWSTIYKEYKPVEYNSPSLKGKPWADPDVEDTNFYPKWNTIDGNINRVSHQGPYEIIDGRPQNPIGRTGIIGRGLLGRWGPNHAADPIVTRWKRLNGSIQNDSINNPILQFVAIQRWDTREWALPGGMVDPGEKVSAAAIREFQEEAMNSLFMLEEEKKKCAENLTNLFNTGEIVYQGYVDDLRNTDNAWMETVAYNFHDETGAIVEDMKLKAGDDAVGVQWVDANSTTRLYGSHKRILNEVLKRKIEGFKA